MSVVSAFFDVFFRLFTLHFKNTDVTEEDQYFQSLTSPSGKSEDHHCFWQSEGVDFFASH